MNTHIKLQNHLATAPREYVAGYWHKDNAPVLKCKDGTILSVQASKNHYSSPREDFGPYSAVEVWCIKPECEVVEFEYSDSDPSAYVPIELVVQFIDNHGGME